MKIQLRTRTDEWNNIQYRRDFEIESELPEVGGIYAGAEVISVNPVTLDCEERKAGEYDAYAVETREDYYTDEDESDMHYIAIPVEIEDIYYIKYNTGAGDMEITGDLEAAKEAADDGAAYTQKNIEIQDGCGNVVAMRRWYGVEPEEDAGDIIRFGNFGYYDEWEMM